MRHVLLFPFYFVVTESESIISISKMTNESTSFDKSFSFDMSSDLSLALRKKNEGKQLFSAGNYREAISKWLESIDLLDLIHEWTDVVVIEKSKVYSNLAECFLRLESYADVIKFASDALSCDPNNVKAYFRRAKAHHSLGDLRAAINDLDSCLSIAPSVQSAVKLRRRLLKRVKKLSKRSQKSKRDDLWWGQNGDHKRYHSCFNHYMKRSAARFLFASPPVNILCSSSSRPPLVPDCLRERNLVV